MNQSVLLYKVIQTSILFLLDPLLHQLQVLSATKTLNASLGFLSVKLKSMNKEVRFKVLLVAVSGLYAHLNKND
jgi:hypothetical protein